MKTDETSELGCWGCMIEVIVIVAIFVAMSAIFGNGEYIREVIQHIKYSW